MYDIDLFETSAATVAALHAESRKVICYVNAGGWENWRPDAALFPGGSSALISTTGKVKSGRTSGESTCWDQ